MICFRETIKKPNDANTWEVLGGNQTRLDQIFFGVSVPKKENEMPVKTKIIPAALFVFGSVASVWANVDEGVEHRGSVASRTLSPSISNDYTAALSRAKMSFAAEQALSLAAPQLAPALGAPLCRRGATEMTWIMLTEPGGKPIYISVEQVTTVRSDTQIPGARAQLDLASGKIQGVQENVEQVMQLIAASAGPRPSDNCA